MRDSAGFSHLNRAAGKMVSYRFIQAKYFPSSYVIFFSFHLYIQLGGRGADNCFMSVPVDTEPHGPDNTNNALLLTILNKYVIAINTSVYLFGISGIFISTVNF
jgi:hypothetical protein